MSPASTAVGLTSDAPGASPGEPQKYYPTKVRTYARLVPDDNVQAAVQVKLQQSLGCSTTYVVDDGEVDGLDMAMSFSDAARRAGLQVVSVQHGERAARQTVALYAVLLVATTMLFVPFDLAGRYYLGAATVLGAAFLALSLRGLRAGARFDVHRWAKQVFAFSVIYLPALLVALLVARA